MVRRWAWALMDVCTLADRLVKVQEARCRNHIYGTVVSSAKWYDVCKRGELETSLLLGLFLLCPARQSGCR